MAEAPTNNKPTFIFIPRLKPLPELEFFHFSPETWARNKNGKEIEVFLCCLFLLSRSLGCFVYKHKLVYYDVMMLFLLLICWRKKCIFFFLSRNVKVIMFVFTCSAWREGILLRMLERVTVNVHELLSFSLLMATNGRCCFLFSDNW